MSRLTRAVATSPFARAASFPIRTRDVLKHDARILAQSGRWLVQSREHTNYTYDLTARNIEHLAWWVATAVRCSVEDVRGYFAELDGNTLLREQLHERTATAPRRRLFEPNVAYGRRYGWYALIRATKPDFVVETGTDKGLGSSVIGAALRANRSGTLLTIDINPDSGWLIGDDYRGLIQHRIGDSVEVISGLTEPIDLFIHDSLHTYDHERRELEATLTHARSGSVYLSDNAHESDALVDFANTNELNFGFFREEPQDHWWPGDGIGLAGASVFK